MPVFSEPSLDSSYFALLMKQLLLRLVCACLCLSLMILDALSYLMPCLVI